MTIDSFVFYRSFYEAIKDLPDADRLNIYDSICEYALDHNDIEKTVVAKGMMALIKPQVDANYKKRMNGSLGGRPKTAQSGEESEDKADNQGEKQNLDETKAKPNNNLDITKGKPNVNVNVNVNANENVNVKCNRHKYGEYKNVLLSDEELEKAKEEIPEYEKYIERISEYCASTGKSYKNYLATLRNWYRRDQDKKPKEETFNSSERYKQPWLED